MNFSQYENKFEKYQKFQCVMDRITTLLGAVAVATIAAAAAVVVSSITMTLNNNRIFYNNKRGSALVTEDVFIFVKSKY